MTDHLDTIADAFIVAALWADCPEGTHPRATNAAKQLARDIAAIFIAENQELFDAAIAFKGWDVASYGPEQFGHDLFLTMAGHGAGFWDRDALDADDIGDKLTDVLRNNWHRWYLETEFYRGWLYLSAPRYKGDAP